MGSVDYTPGYRWVTHPASVDYTPNHGGLHTEVATKPLNYNKKRATFFSLTYLTCLLTESLTGIWVSVWALEAPWPTFDGRQWARSVEVYKPKIRDLVVCLLLSLIKTSDPRSSRNSSVAGVRLGLACRVAVRVICPPVTLLGRCRPYRSRSAASPNMKCPPI